MHTPHWLQWWKEGSNNVPSGASCASANKECSWQVCGCSGPCWSVPRQDVHCEEFCRFLQIFADVLWCIRCSGYAFWIWLVLRCLVTWSSPKFLTSHQSSATSKAKQIPMQCQPAACAARLLHHHPRSKVPHGFTSPHGTFSWGEIMEIVNRWISG